MQWIRSFVSWNRKLARRLDERFPSFVAYPSYLDELLTRIERDLSAHPGDVLEVGGIDRPLLSKRSGISYDGIDIDEKEACYEIYDRFYVQSIEEPVPERYRHIISITLLEHVPDNTAAVNNMFAALEAGGVTHHYVPSMNHPYSLALRAVGPRLQKKLIAILRPQSVGETGYPTFFDHCTVARMSAVFERAGFRDIDVVPYYRAHDYFAFFLPAYVAVIAFENLCKRMDWRPLASGFVISGRKPEAA